MTNTQKVKKQYTGEELIRIFVKRLDDDLFASVGVKTMTIAEQKKAKPHLAVWIGYETLLGVKK